MHVDIRALFPIRIFENLLNFDIIIQQIQLIMLLKSLNKCIDNTIHNLHNFIYTYDICISLEIVCIDMYIYIYIYIYKYIYIYIYIYI